MLRVSKRGAEALRARLYPGNSELPQSVRSFLDDEAPKPTYSLMFQTKNLNVESVLDPVEGQGKLQGKKRIQRYALGPLATQQQEKRQPTAEIVSSCPERLVMPSICPPRSH